MGVSPFDLTRKKILVTGAGSGLGRAFSIQASAMGASLILVGRNLHNLQQTKADCANSDNQLLFSCDLRDSIQVESLKEIIKAETGRLDGLIHFAGVSLTKPLQQCSDEVMLDFMHQNLIVTLRLLRVFSHFSVLKTGASLVVLSSVIAHAGTAGKALYSASKAGIEGAIRPMAVELAKRKIRINAICPGVVPSPMTESQPYFESAESLKAVADMHLLGLGKGEDIANAGIFLLSAASAWITGTSLIVDGGYLVR